MSHRYTKEELQGLRDLSKKVTNPGVQWSYKPKQFRSFMQRTFKVTGAAQNGIGREFLVYQRKNLLDEDDYSCGIVYLTLEGPKLPLARYNGRSHIHKDILGEIHYKPHIHVATEEAIASGRKPDCMAKETTRYDSMGEALRCLAKDFNLSGLPNKDTLPDLYP